MKTNFYIKEIINRSETECRFSHSKKNVLKICMLFLLLAFGFTSCTDDLVEEMEEEITATVNNEVIVNEVNVEENMANVNSLEGEYIGSIEFIGHGEYYLEKETFKLFVNKKEEGIVELKGSNVLAQQVILQEINGKIMPSSLSPALKVFNWNPDSKSMSFRIIDSSKKINIAFVGVLK